MAHTDPIADMLTRIRNSSAVKKAEVVLPYSKLKEKIAEILKEEGYISAYSVLPAAKGVNYQQLQLSLRYDRNGVPAVMHIKKVSKPGGRVYSTKDELPIVLNNLGVAIISTSRGLMTNKRAKREGLGGEVLCEVD